jgi:hypothetical protein
MAELEESLPVRKFRTGSRITPIVYRYQCQECGRKHGRKLDPFDLPTGESPKRVSWGRERAKEAKRPNSMQRRRSAKSAKDRKGPQWRRIFERDNWTCQGCGYDDDAEELEVHHVSYPEIPEDDVPDSELQTVCGACNMAERNERMSGGQGGRVGVR